MAQTSVEFANSKPGGIYLKPGLPEKKVQHAKKKVSPIAKSRNEVVNSRELPRAKDSTS